MDKKVYLVKDIAGLSGFSSYTIKYYLQRGLIKEIGRSPGTNFRYFDDATLDTLKKIKDYRKEKISLGKIIQIFKDEK